MGRRGRFMNAGANSTGVVDVKSLGIPPPRGFDGVPDSVRSVAQH